MYSSKVAVIDAIHLQGSRLMILLSSPGCKAASPRERWNKAEAELVQAESEQKRFYVLAEAAKSSFDVGERDKAKQYADELVCLAGKYNKDWN